MAQRPPGSSLRTLGVDTGGTFTDLVELEGGRERVAKLASTPADPGRAVIDGIALLGGARGAHVIHGTTVALNALLTGRTARTALVSNEGLVDLVELARQDRPDLYALHPRLPAPLVPRELRFGVPQRSWPDPAGGRRLVEVERPDDAALEALCEALRAARPQSVAICLLHSYADAAIEERIARALAPLGVPLTCSARVLPEHREYERFSTAVVSASLVPLMQDYLSGLERHLQGARLSLLQSSGGTLPARRAAQEPVRVLLSGPAGGVVGASRAALEAGFARMVGLDMGGTSTDVAFHDSAAPAVLRGEALRVAGHAVAIPSLDIHTIGCGGGSILAVDSGGVLHVGPRSAGADPGPVCYGRSEEPTLTDAHVLLGHLAPGRFLAGELELDVDAVQRAFERLGRRLGVPPLEAAAGALAVARAAMRRALAVMTMQRGQDPASLPLVAFGGAGGLHAAALAQSLGMRCALVPRGPGVLSAQGMASAAALRERARTLLAPLASVPARERARLVRELGALGKAELMEEGWRAGAIELEALYELRYAGQSFELAVAADGRGDPAAAFHRAHEALYGYALPEREVELVAVRVRSTARVRPPPVRKVRARPMPSGAVVGQRAAVLSTGNRPRKVPVIDRAMLAEGHQLQGPALVEELSATTLVPARWSARVTAGLHLWIQPPGPLPA